MTTATAERLMRPGFLTTKQAADYTGYSRPDSFTRAWRAAGLSFWRRPGGHLLVNPVDLERFLTRAP